MKKCLFAAFFLIFSGTIFAQNKINSESLLALREARLCFDNNDFGRALKYSEDAILIRKNQIEAEYSTIENSLAPKEVRAAGDRIDNVLLILEEREDYDCINIIRTYTDKKGIEYFNNSIQELKKYILAQKEYPEAYKLIGDIYKLEGEYDFAEDYYKKALDNEGVLDVPDEKFEILYLLADISRLKNDFDRMEIRLLNVIGTQQLEKNKIISRAIKNTVKADLADNVNKTFQLYRTYDFYSLKAYCLLADYYYGLGENDKAFNYSALAVINGFTKVCKLLEKRNLDYSFSTLEGFFDEVPNYPDIVEWGSVNYVWKSFNVLADICISLGYKNYAMELLTVIAYHSPEKYWQQDAVLKLDTMDGIKNP